MPDRFEPISAKCPHILHGGDYNPDQWPAEMVDEDLRLMELAHCNAMTIGIFAWARLEPEEGRYEFDWLDAVMDKLAAAGRYAVLATPTAAHPAWMSAAYPEVLRMGPDGRRRHGGRVNYCLTSPLYRTRCAEIARCLAERYGRHPALLVWHVHNEYGGACYCPLCREAFRSWLKEKYGSLDRLNHEWWTAFWSHTFTRWDQIDPPAPYGEGCVQGLTLDWNRFVTDQTIACYRNEADILRAASPGIPVTTNTYWLFVNFDGRRWAPHLDVAAWDNYPMYHDRDDDWRLAAGVSFNHDYYRALLGGRPFMMMESTPSSANWMPVMKLKRPGIHALASLQAVAHGSDTVQYFQWRASRGGAEKFHGAVVSHAAHEHTRVFREVAEIGSILERLDDVIGTTVRPEVAVVCDKEVEWAIAAAAGPRHEKRDYVPTCQSHYLPFWRRGISVDVVHMDVELGPYRLLVAPMLYLLRPGAAERIIRFVESGGTFVTTYWSGIVNENDLCFQGGFPGPLRGLLGIWSEELDVLHDGESNTVVPAGDAGHGLSGQYRAAVFCDLVHAGAARVLAAYGGGFYAGRPALTVNEAGRGRAYYIASRNEERFLEDFTAGLVSSLGLRPVVPGPLPEGVTAQVRSDGEREFVFLLNFKRDPASVHVGAGPLTDVLSGETVSGAVPLGGYGARILRREAARG